MPGCKTQTGNCLSSFRDRAIAEQELLVIQLDHLAEMDRRKLHFEYPSLRAYLVAEFGMEECLISIRGMSCAAARRELAARYPHSLELPHDKVRPLTAELSLLSCVVDRELLELVEDIKGLLSHSHPGISLGELFKHVAVIKQLVYFF